MGRLFYLIFIAPWWVYAAAAAVFLYLSQQVYLNEIQEQADAKAALAQPVPDRVDLSDFDRQRDTGLADEVHIGGWINTDFNYHLREIKKGKVRTEGYMYVLQGSRDTSGTKQVRAILLLSEQDKKTFVSRVSEFQVSGMAPTPEKPYFAFNGVKYFEAPFTKLVDNAFKEQGLTRGEDFIVVKPFWEGRNKGLAYTDDPQRRRVKYWKYSGVLLALAFIKLGLAHRRKQKQRQRSGYRGGRDVFADSPIASGSRKSKRFGRPDYESSQPEPQPHAMGRLQHAPSGISIPEQKRTGRVASEGLAKPSLFRRVTQASRKSQMILLGLVLVLPLSIWKPAFGGMVLPIGTMLFIYLSIGMKAVASVRGALEEVGLLKPRLSRLAKGDPFSRLEAEARNLR